MTYDISLVKRLRSETQAPLSDCQKALKSANGDYEEAKVHLRKIGLANADKRSLRNASSGVIAAFGHGSFGAIMEISSETDFVSRGEMFHALACSILVTAYHNKIDRLDELMKFKINMDVIRSYFPKISQIFNVDFKIKEDGLEQIDNESIEHAIKIAGSVVGENISISKFDAIFEKEGYVFSYLHNRRSELVGSAGAILAIKTEANTDKIKDLMKKLAMHTVVLKPEVLNVTDIDPAILKKEKEIYREQLVNEGKSGDIVEKIILGKLNKYYERVVLLKQPYFFDNAINIEMLLKNVKIELNAVALSLSSFKSFF